MSLKWVARLNLIPGLWKDVNMVKGAHTHPAQFFKVKGLISRDNVTP